MINHNHNDQDEIVVPFLKLGDFSHGFRIKTHPMPPHRARNVMSLMLANKNKLCKQERKHLIFRYIQNGLYKKAQVPLGDEGREEKVQIDSCSQAFSAASHCRSLSSMSTMTMSTPKMRCSSCRPRAAACGMQTVR